MSWTHSSRGQPQQSHPTPPSITTEKENTSIPPPAKLTAHATTITTTTTTNRLSSTIHPLDYTDREAQYDPQRTNENEDGEMGEETRHKEEHHTASAE